MPVCEKVLDAAASVVHIFDVSLEILLHFISAVPREFTDFGGTLITSGIIYEVYFSFCNSLFC